jgi:hypothetical protein
MVCVTIIREPLEDDISIIHHPSGLALIRGYNIVENYPMKNPRVGMLVADGNSLRTLINHAKVSVEVVREPQ